VSVRILALHLTPIQSQSVARLCQIPDLPLDRRLILNRVLTSAYEKWARKKAIEFKEFHVYKCRNIPLEDLLCAAHKGLCNSVRNYNGGSHFPNYAIYYVRGELYNLVTDHFYLSQVPKKLRIKNRNRLSEDEMAYYANELKIEKNAYHTFKNTASLLVPDSPFSLEDIDMDPEVKRIIRLKYDSDFRRVKNNRQIAEEVGCCQETVRQKLAKLKRF
jgi:RNA polymerase sigma factor (sigma-70 family)